MQALALKPSFGWSWIRAGWRLLRSQPLGFIVLFFFYLMILVSASTVVRVIALAFGSSALVETVGIALVAIATPALAVGFMQAARDASGPTGKAAGPLALFGAFRAGRAVVVQLLWIGVVEFLAATVVLTLMFGPEPDAVTAPVTTTEQRAAETPAKPPSAAQAPTELTQEQRDAIFRTARSFPLYLLIELILWYAPVLVAWHRLSAPKAIFFSAVAVWRNLGAFVVYGLGWFVILIALSAVLSVARLSLGQSVAGILTVPLAVLMMSWLFCSKYPTYESVFVDPGDPSRTLPVDDPPR